MQNIRRTGCTVFLFLAANLPFFDYFVQVGFRQKPMLVLVPVVCFLILNIFPVWGNGRIPSKRLRICAGGCELLICFLSSSVLSGVVLLSMLPVVFGENKLLWAADFVCVVCTEAVVFWNGILRVYLTSAQIGFKWRVIGIVCGWIPVVHIAVLVKIIRMASEEWRFEGGKLLKAQERADERLCATRYPLLLVHGVFFRDFEHFNYWGRIPRELEQNGASVFYGNHQSAASVADSGRELADRIQEIIKDTGCGKVNVIAHSKGGLDTRYAVSCLGMSRYVASLTTINTPHRGCVFADYLLNKLPAAVKDKVAGAYNTALKKMGDEQPDFIAAVTDLTASACETFNQNVADVQDVYYQSVGSKLNKASDGRFPLNFSHHLVKYFDGPNDGLVSETSFAWGADYTFLTCGGNRGISHGDMIDLNRENIKEFDVREFYVMLVNGLKERGL
ncbi:triacylglycerol lipase [Lachnospiraceae bacterium 50-23]|jgi:triacylglycerol lipase|nr:triacylglycerol lipase [Dorea sp.]GFI36077.1 triacylglycerol lipase [Lachnospiraceae bacterium]